LPRPSRAEGIECPFLSLWGDSFDLVGKARDAEKLWSGFADDFAPPASRTARTSRRKWTRTCWTSSKVGTDDPPTLERSELLMDKPTGAVVSL